MAKVVSLTKKRKKYPIGWKGSNRRNRNELVSSRHEDALERFKYEIASELGIELGPETTARANGTVGGMMVKRMIGYAERHMDDILDEMIRLDDLDLDDEEGAV